MTSEKAFSLVELMVVVVIVAILSIVSIPNYRDYMNKAKVTSMISTIEPCKNQVYQYFFKNGSLPDGTTTGQTIDCQGVTLRTTSQDLGNNVNASFTYDSSNSSFIFNLTHSGLLSGANGISITLSNTNGDLVYSCRGSITNGVPTNLLPASCS